MLLSGSEEQSGFIGYRPESVNTPPLATAQFPSSWAPEPMETGQDWSVMVERQLLPPTDTELYQKLVGMFGRMGKTRIPLASNPLLIVWRSSRFSPATATVL